MTSSACGVRGMDGSTKTAHPPLYSREGGKQDGGTNG